MVTKYENVFDDSFCEEIYNNCIDAISNGLKYQWKSNYSWQTAVFGGSFPVLCRQMDSEYSEKILDILLEKEIISTKNYCVNNYAWTRLSHIPWHDDSAYTAPAVTIYLNPVWDENWGGIFMYKEKDSNEIHGLLPTFNTAVRINDYTLHSVSCVSPLAPYPRYTLQLFPTKTIFE